MRVVLLQAKTKGYNGESLSLSFLAATLRENGIETDILDAHLLQMSNIEVCAFVKNCDPQLIGLTIMHQDHVSESLELLKFLRRYGVKSRFVVGGVFATVEHIAILKNVPEIEYVIRGEGEIPLLQLVQALQSNIELRDVPSLSYRSPLSGRIRINQLAPLISKLDSLPHPSRDHTETVIKMGKRVVPYRLLEVAMQTAIFVLSYTKKITFGGSSARSMS